jgi:beta-glucosidase/6-phospho-beta-glucosidase/beta-galactosidase
LGEKVRYLSRLFPKNPIMILENGSVVTADGVTREEYLRRHVAEVLRGRRAGFNLMGYICWSITTNRELGAPFNEESDFGLFHVKLDTDSTLRRRRTPAAAVYRQIINEERRREKSGE